MEKYSPPKAKTDNSNRILPYNKVRDWLKSSIDNSPPNPKLYNREKISSDDSIENDSNREEEIKGPNITKLLPY